MTFPLPIRRLPVLWIQRLAGIFVVLAGTVILGLFSWHMTTDRNLSLEVGQSRVENLARVVAREIDASLGEADRFVAESVRQLEHSRHESTGSESFPYWLQDQMAGHPNLQDVFIYDRDGRLITAFHKADGADRGESNLDGFNYHASHKDGEAYISAITKERLTGEITVEISRRISTRGERFAGVVLARIHIDAPALLYNEYTRESLHLELSMLKNETSSSTLAGRKRWNGSSPNNLSEEGQNLSAFSQLDHYPLGVKITLSQDAVLHYWYNELYRSAAVVAFVIIALGFFGSILIQQVKTLVMAKQQLRTAHDALEKLALHDPMTGLANRRQLDVLLPAEIGRASRNMSPLALIMLDIDHFKRYNDLYGHPAGDECIRAVAQVVKTTIKRAGDLAVRYGGEEVLVLLPNTDEAGAYQVAERILQAVRALNMEHSGNAPGVVTISAGVSACFPRRNDMTPQGLIKAADQALYIAKFTGRNKVHSSLINTLGKLMKHSAA